MKPKVSEGLASHNKTDHNSSKQKVALMFAEFMGESAASVNREEEKDAVLRVPLLMGKHCQGKIGP